MTIEVQLDQLTNKKSIVAIFINGRPIHWTAYIQEKDAGDNKIWRNIIYPSFLKRVITKYTDLDDVTDGNIQRGVELLKKVMNREDVDKVIQVDALLETIASNMINQNYLS